MTHCVRAPVAPAAAVSPADVPGMFFITSLLYIGVYESIHIFGLAITNLFCFIFMLNLLL